MHELFNALISLNIQRYFFLMWTGRGFPFHDWKHTQKQVLCNKWNEIQTAHVATTPVRRVEHVNQRRPRRHSARSLIDDVTSGPRADNSDMAGQHEW